MPQIPSEILEEVKAFMALIPFNRLLQLTVEELGEGYCRMMLPFREELIGDPMRRALHGGVISSCVDTVGGAALWTKCEMGDRLSTVDLRVDYLRPGLTETLYVDGKVLRLGNRVGVTEMKAYHAGRKDEPIAVGMAVYNVKRAGD